MSNQGSEQCCVPTPQPLWARIKNKLRFPLYRLPFYGPVYRAISKLSHRFNWHYMKPMGPFPDGSRQLWCQWCGARHTIHKPSTVVIP